MFRRAWAGLERTVGQEDLAVYNTVFSLGVPCKEQSRLGEAEEMFRCCLQGYENLSRPDSMETLRTARSLGRLYHTQGKLEEAVAMMQRTFEGFEKSLGPFHTSTPKAGGVHLAALYTHGGKLAEAEKMYRLVLKGSKAIGLEHQFINEAAYALGKL